MRTKEKRGRGFSPLAIRALGVLAISLMAMTTSLASTPGVPTCEQVCDRIAWTACPVTCTEVHGLECLPYNVSRWCIDNCTYTIECTNRPCESVSGNPGKRVECSLEGQRPPGW